jgi:hypothetical protein
MSHQPVLPLMGLRDGTQLNASLCAFPMAGAT